MAKKSKKFLAAQAQVPDEPIAPLAEMNLLKEISSANFDETVEAHFRLGIDTRQADQQLRGTVSLPNGSGKSVRVAVFAEGEAARVAEEAGADIVGTEELIAQVQAGEFNFDAAVATPDQMGKHRGAHRSGPGRRVQLRRRRRHPGSDGQGRPSR